MTALRISASTSCALDSINARVTRIKALTSGVATVESLRRADQELAALASEARSLRMPVRQEAAAAERREREDQSIRRSA